MEHFLTLVAMVVVQVVLEAETVALILGNQLRRAVALALLVKATLVVAVLH